MKNNFIQDNFHKFYKAVIFLILLLPIVNFEPYFHPPSWTKAIALKFLITFLITVLTYSLLFKYKKLDLSPLKRNPIIWAFGAFYAVFFLSSLFSVNPFFSFWGSPERGGGFVNLLFYGLFAIISVLILKNGEWKKAWRFAFGAAMAICLVSLFHFFGLFGPVFANFDFRAGSTVGNPITLSIYLLLLLFVAIPFFITEGEKNLKIFYGSAIALFLIGIFLSGSRASYLGVLASTFYFLILYPSKTRKIRFGAFALLILSISIVLTATYTIESPNFTPENRLFREIIPRLSIRSLAGEERFKTWRTVIEVIAEKPILGWGPENLAVGFDKHFDPTKTPSGWWDRSHNTYLDAASSAGILGLVAYLGIFVILFLNLQKIKNFWRKNDENLSKTMLAHGVQSGLVGYITANIFSFDSFSTLLMFFFISAYSIWMLHDMITIKEKNINSKIPGNLASKNTHDNLRFLSYMPLWKKKVFFSSFIFISLLFVWKYNFSPFYINSELRIQRERTQAYICNESIDSMGDTTLRSKMLGEYALMQYIEAIKKCADAFPNEKITYTEKGLKVVEEFVLTYPLSSRIWSIAGGLSSTLAVLQEDPTIKKSLIDKSRFYFEKSLSLSPKNTDTILEIAQLDLLLNDCQSVKERTQQCSDINPNEGKCYWVRALSAICRRDNEAAEKDINLAISYNFQNDSIPAIQQLINAYIASKNYEKVAELLEFLVEKYPLDIQYRASLASAYYEIGNYQKAREMALSIIDIIPEAKGDVEAFLKTLPAQYR